MWYQLQIDHCPSNQADYLSEVLEENGALSVTFTDKFDQPILEPDLGTTPLWPDVIITALFADEATADHTYQALAHRYPHLTMTVETLADRDWQQEWMVNLKPQQFGTKLWVCPSWLTPPDPQAINLILDPGLAFGTGSHPTTSLCLTWLEQAPMAGQTLIDYGCGSGILALAALKLGALHVHAVDIDEQALQATHNNAALNQVDTSQLTVCLPDALTTSATIIIANILLKPLITLQETFQALLQHDGLLVVSGILITQVPLLIESYAAHFHHQQTYHLDDWSLVVFCHSRNEK